MNTHACFIFLLAIGASAQRSEFEIDFRKMVNTVRLKDNGTLLNCTEKCGEVKEAACECRRFNCLEETSFINCIKNGLGNLSLTQTGNIIVRLTKLERKCKDKSILTDEKLAQEVSPKYFLDYILNLYQKINAQIRG